HRVPGADDALRRAVEEWGRQAKVEVAADIIDSNAAWLMVAAEAQARVGHDFLCFWPWHAYRPERTKRPDLTGKGTKQERHAALRVGSGAVRSGLNPSVFSDTLCWPPQT